MMSKIVKCWFLLLAVVITTGCNSDDDNYGGSDPQQGANNRTDFIVTGGAQASGMTYADVLIYVNYQNDQNSESYVKQIHSSQYGYVGVKYGLSKDALTEEAPMVSVSGRKVSVTVRNLKPNTTYYYKAYIRGGDVEYFGTELGTFTTKALSYNGTVTAGNVTEKSYASMTIGFGTMSGLSSKETYIRYLAWSYDRLRLESGLETRFKKAIAGKEDEPYVSNDGVGFYLDYGANINNGKVQLSDLEKTTVYYLSLISFGGKLFTSDIKSVSSRSLADELRLADVEWANIGFNFVEIGDNSIPVLYDKKTGASLTASDFDGEQYSFGYAYSPMVENLDNNLYKRYKATSFTSSSDNLAWEEGANNGVGFIRVHTLDKHEISISYNSGSPIVCCAFLEMGGQFIMGPLSKVTTRQLAQKSGFVDLGLSCKWAAYNLGAYNPFDAGTVGRLFSDSNLEDEFGSGARLPTSNEVKELNNCTREVIYDRNGHEKGILVTGNNGNQLYFPYTTYSITHNEWRTYQKGSLYENYAVYYQYNNNQFNPTEMCYYYSYGGTGTSRDIKSHARAVSNSAVTPSANIDGDYSATLYEYNNGNLSESDNYTIRMSVSNDNPSVVYISNFFNNGRTIIGTIDAQTNYITIGDDQIVYVHDTYGEFWTISVTQGFDYTTLLPMENNPSAYESNVFALQCSLGVLNYYLLEMYPIQASSSRRVAKGKRGSVRPLKFRLKSSGRLIKNPYHTK